MPEDDVLNLEDPSLRKMKIEGKSNLQYYELKHSEFQPTIRWSKVSDSSVKHVPRTVIMFPKEAADDLQSYVTANLPCSHSVNFLKYLLQKGKWYVTFSTQPWKKPVWLTLKSVLTQSSLRFSCQMTNSEFQRGDIRRLLLRLERLGDLGEEGDESGSVIASVAKRGVFKRARTEEELVYEDQILSRVCETRVSSQVHADSLSRITPPRCKRALLVRAKCESLESRALVLTKEIRATEDVLTQIQHLGTKIHQETTRPHPSSTVILKLTSDMEKASAVLKSRTQMELPELKSELERVRKDIEDAREEDDEWERLYMHQVWGSAMASVALGAAPGMCSARLALECGELPEGKIYVEALKRFLDACLLSQNGPQTAPYSSEILGCILGQDPQVDQNPRSAVRRLSLLLHEDKLARATGIPKCIRPLLEGLQAKLNQLCQDVGVTRL